MAVPSRLSLVPRGDPSAGATYPAVNASEIARVEIFPALGVARFGDSQREYFLCPEVPGNTRPPTGATEFRDADHRIRRQAVRFRAYAYNAQNTLLGEVNGNNGYNLTWMTHVANTKGANYLYIFRGRSTNLRNPNVQGDLPPDGRSRLIIDPGAQSISTSTTPDFVNLRGIFQGSNEEVTENNHVYLGQLQVDGAGRLIVVPSTGVARSVARPADPQPELLDKFNNVDWYDTACDGWVRVQVTTQQGFNMRSGHDATVVCGPPNFAWGVNGHSSLYDIMENIYPPMRNNYNFEWDIWPILKSASLISWSNDSSHSRHGPGRRAHYTSQEIINRLPEIAFRRSIFRRLRNPNGQPSGNMPDLTGDNADLGAALTPLQYERFTQWKDDENFGLPRPWPPQLASRIEDVRLQDQPEYLTRASAESTIGDALQPGIETSRLPKDRSTYNLDVANLVPPFRVNHASVRPGHLTRGLCLPWQSDFLMCHGQGGTPWWPSVRPDQVAIRENNIHTFPSRILTFTTAGQVVGGPRTQMTRYWQYLGIVREDGNNAEYIESERSPRLRG